jgi:hypothetical protein
MASSIRRLEWPQRWAVAHTANALLRCSMPSGRIYEQRVSDCNKLRITADHSKQVEMSMSKLTMAVGADGAGTESSGFFKQILARIAAARQAQAQRIVDAHLATLSDARLREIGYDPAVVRARGGAGYFPIWS